MGKNKLVLNSDKTLLLVMASAHKHRKLWHCVEYWSRISTNFTCKNHMRDNKTSMFKILTIKINALSKVSRIAKFKTNKNDCIRSSHVHPEVPGPTLWQLWWIPSQTTSSSTEQSGSTHDKIGLGHRDLSFAKPM